MKTAICGLLGLSLLAGLAGPADAAPRAKKRTYAPAYERSQGSDYTERLADKQQFGSSAWWQQMDRERRGGTRRLSAVILFHVRQRCFGRLSGCGAMGCAGLPAERNLGRKPGVDEHPLRAGVRVTSTSKRILITGAGSGIGRDSARALAERGHTVHATTHSEEQAAAWRSAGLAGVDAFKLDITDAGDRARIAELPIDVLVNNAAIGQSGSLAEVPLERIRATFETNLFATLALTQIALKPMISRRRGRIVFISSLVGRIPAPFLMPYSMTKFALVGCGRRAAPGAGAARLRRRRGPGRARRLPHRVQPAHARDQVRVDARRLLLQGPDAPAEAGGATTACVLEVASTGSIVRQIVRAVEAHKPRARYVAPWWQGFGVRLLRAFGK